jgi:HisJ family histidinol phosphate phosphatase
MEEMILQGISKGLTTMCFTEHNDFDFPITDLDPKGKFECNADLYFKEFKEYQKKYADRVQLLFGIELGLQPSVMTRNKAYVEAHEFDFIIGSSHLCNGIDPSCPEFYKGRSEEEAYQEYFESIVENILSFSDFDVYGHLDYVVRYGPNKDKYYTFEKYQDILDPILKLLIENGKGIGYEILNGLNSNNWFNPDKFHYTWGLILYIVLTIAFAYFYTSITFNPLEIANNMKKSGGFIPGIRPGKPTVDYLARILKYIIFVGAVGLVIVQVIPFFFNGFFGAMVSFGGTSLIIIVGVVLETIQQIESQMLVRNYKGFLNNGK